MLSFCNKSVKKIRNYLENNNSVICYFEDIFLFFDGLVAEAFFNVKMSQLCFSSPLNLCTSLPDGLALHQRPCW